MFFPISDDDRDVTIVSYVTHTLLAINIVVFCLQWLYPQITYGWSVVPRELITGIDLVEPVTIAIEGNYVTIPQAPGPSFIWFTLLSSMFMHGGLGHIVGNMLYLWIFGNNVEQRFGHFRFLIFYLVSGLVGSIAQIVVSPGSVIPMLGASGAISGVMGAYLMLFPHNRINVIFFFQIITVPAIVVLGMWGITQFLGGWGSLGSKAGGVAYLAHIGGFVAGAVAGLMARAQLKQEPDSLLYRQYQRDPKSRLWW
ncbi:rhomboid family intramembrane serine protease [Pirellulaceae bacterium SH449]